MQSVKGHHVQDDLLKCKIAWYTMYKFQQLCITCTKLKINGN